MKMSALIRIEIPNKGNSRVALLSSSLYKKLLEGINKEIEERIREYNIKNNKPTSE